MKKQYALLRFTEDKNLKDRGYWYVSDFSVREGERVLAPVGMHDRLQCALVERAVEAEEKDAPYDPALIKRIAAKYGARVLPVGDDMLLDFGGVRYDDRHFIPYGRLYLCDRKPWDMATVCSFGITKLLEMRDGVELYEEIASSLGSVLLVGEEGKKTFRTLYALCRGELEMEEPLQTELKEKLL